MLGAAEMPQEKKRKAERMMPEDEKSVNLLDLAAAAITATVAAARPIQEFVSDNNARLKTDGSVVTDADIAAQGYITRTLRQVSPSVVIVGEESTEEIDVHQEGLSMTAEDNYIASIMRLAQEEVRNRYFGRSECPLAEGNIPSASDDSRKRDDLEDDDSSLIVNSDRLRIFVDPLDGSKAYASGDYDTVTILIAIIFDGRPYFGVIAKPFGYNQYATLLDTNCFVLYGGELLKSHAYFAGVSESCGIPPLPANQSPRAIISSSRCAGVVKEFCTKLAAKNLIHPEPLSVSGAGEKSLRLIIGKEQERLWFFPKEGTSLWDVAASDALLRALGGKLTNRHGQELDYGKSRLDSANTEGIIASNDAVLHAECIRLFRKQLTSENNEAEKCNDINQEDCQNDDNKGS